jgi:Protein of unknown function (DUF1569)
MDNILTAQGKQRVLTRMSMLHPDSQRLWGKMNVTQMLTHLSDAHRLALGMIDARDESSWYSRWLMFPVAVYVLPSWPYGMPTAASMDALREGSTPRDFYTEIGTLQKLIDVFAEREATKIKPHPMFGDISKVQWADLFTRHFNHHFKQFGV